MKFTDERLAAILRGRRAFRVIDFPGAPPEAGVKIAVRVLTEAELDSCRLQSQVKLRSFCETRKWDPTTVVDIDPGLVSRYSEREIVWSAFYDPETIDKEQPDRFFQTVRDVESLDATSLTRLHEAYNEHQEWAAPLHRMTEEEVQGMIEQLGNAQSAPAELHRCERSTLVRFVISLASRLRSSTSPTSKSSPTPS